MNQKSEDVIVVRSDIEQRSSYRDYKEDLRIDFYFSCAYCSMTEVEAMGIGFDIDHYLPKSTDPDLKNDYNNLMWACQKCNLYKGSYKPDNHDLKIGNYVLRPDVHDPANHFELEGMNLFGKTKTGEFNIERLELNRLCLRRLRKIRKDFHNSNEYILNGIRKILATKIDQISPQYRLLFLKLKRLIEEKQRKRVLSLQELEFFARSPMLDSDPDKRQRTKARRAYLKQQKAIIP